MIRFLIHVVTGRISSVLGLLLAGWLVPWPSARHRWQAMADQAE